MPKTIEAMAAEFRANMQRAKLRAEELMAGGMDYYSAYAQADKEILREESDNAS